ncbi:MAG: hypothetical protein HYR85_00710 [Planctomycetes bacterium]|nr:hypothetical protein [Planctomycetota bacterium]MBI3847494.1 hypothetical protein [Planctomycetota bacterium]
MSIEDAMSLLDAASLFDLLSLGRDLREQRHGRRVSAFVADHPAAWTGPCPFCEFTELEVEVDAATGSAPLHPSAGRAFHAPHVADPRRGIAAIVEGFRMLRSSTGECEVQAVTVRGVAAAAAVDRSRLAAAFEQLRGAGVVHLRGGAPIDPAAADATEVFEWHRDAHRAGIQTDLGIAYDTEHVRGFVSLLDAARRESRSSGTAFASIVPIPKAADSTGSTDLRAVAIARLMLDGVTRVGASFRDLTEKLAPMALGCGADFLAVVASPRPAPSPTTEPDPALLGVPIDELRRLVGEANFELQLEPPALTKSLRQGLG